MITIRKTATGQRNDYTTSCLLDYPYFKEHCNLTAIDLSKRQKLDADPKAIRKIEFAGNLKRKATIFLITEESKETFLDFSKGTIKVL